ncbi:MAG: ASKHA domain-containing protein [Oscillospiraceae bacterium]|nr:ASKHA domain-containing protein [Oscillospiraceae bacterium]
MPKDSFGAAIDIGTTTVALYLLNKQTGEKLAAVGGTNAQIPYGADVTSRIKYCAVNGHDSLTDLIREQISSMINEACALAGIQPDDIESLVLAANTVMQHIAAGLSPVTMGTAPFATLSLFGEELPPWEGLPVSKNALIYYTPAISAYVGGDITAGLLAAGFEDITEPAIFLDIGTNGEIVLKHKGVYYCCATAAGPAFEGAEIEMGMASEDGAIDHVWSINNKINFSVIGNCPPKGLCGSGLLDALAVLLETGEVDETGRLITGDKFWITYQEQNDKKGVFITAGDIRKLQLAKAAIAAGIQVLLHFAGVTEKDIKHLILAGGFGSYMDLNSAARIGLFPKNLLPVAKALGNTAGEGAALAVGSKAVGSKAVSSKAVSSKEMQTRLSNIQKQCEYIELSSIAFFNEKFVEEMAFDSNEIET